MNPFLHDTVAKPLIHAAGIAALSWAACANAVDLNSASQVELQQVKGIGPKTAQIIIEERKRAGTYQSFSDLSDRVQGIGPKKAQALQASGLTIGKDNAAIKPTAAKTK